MPEIWKPGTSPSDSFPTTLAEISRHARPAGLVEEIAERVPGIYKNVTKDEGDDHRAHWAEYIIREKRPDLMLVHLFDLDHAEHNRGPFTPEAFAILEKVDGYVARILSAAERAGTLPETAVFIVSDRGFRADNTSTGRVCGGGLARRATRRRRGAQTQTVVTWRVNLTRARLVRLVCATRRTRRRGAERAALEGSTRGRRQRPRRRPRGGEQARRFPDGLRDGGNLGTRRRPIGGGAPRPRGAARTATCRCRTTTARRSSSPASMSSAAATSATFT